MSDLTERLPKPMPRKRTPLAPISIDPTGTDGESAQASEQQKATITPRSKSERRKSVATPAAAVTGKLRATSLSLPAALAARFTQEARHQDTSLVGFILKAVSDSAASLGDLVQAEQAKDRVPTGDLFPTPVVTRRGRGQGSTVISVRIPADNLAVLDRLVTQHKAASRSQLVTAALRATL